MTNLPESIWAYEGDDRVEYVRADIVTARIAAESEPQWQDGYNSARDDLDAESAHISAREAKLAEIDDHRRKVIAENERMLNALIDKDRRIAAIEAQLAESPQEDEAVAWLYDWTDDDGVTHTEASTQSVTSVNFKETFNKRPLYTHPPAPAVTEAQIEAAARNIASLYGSPDECVQGSGGSGTSGVSFQCQKRAWENYVAHARAALQAIEVKK